MTLILLLRISKKNENNNSNIKGVKMEVTTVDVTTASGSDKFPLNANDPDQAVETIARQTIRSAENGNALEDAFYEYEVEN